MSMIPRIDVETASRAKLVEHIEQLEWMLTDTLPRFHETAALRDVLKLSVQQSLILGALMTGRLCAKQHLLNIASKWKETIGEKQVDILLCRIRKRLMPHGITIKTVWGEGWQIDADNLQRLRTLLDGAQ